MTATLDAIYSRRDALPAFLGRENLNRLVSLWRMIEILAGTLNEIPEGLVCLWSDYLGGKAPEPGERDEIVRQAITVCRKIGWSDIARQGERFLDNAGDPEVRIDELKALANDFYHALQDKMQGLQLVAVEDRDRGIFASASAEFCGGALHQDLAIPEEEFNLAGRALSVGMSTAAVFHAMRSVEASLQFLAAFLGASFAGSVKLQDWVNLTQKIQKELSALEQQPRSQQKIEQQQRFSELALPADGFRLAWRNHVSHAREKYEDPEARRVLRHVGEFLSRLSVALQPV